jgi:molybdenum cofactor guanylyltransferase
MKSQIEESSVTGIILAGGRSERMGSDKGLMVWKGKPLVQYSIEALRPFCYHIIISTNNDKYAGFGFPLLKDEYPNIGPMGGLHAGLKASKTEHNLFLPCDMPLINEEVIRLLLQNSENYQAVVPVVDKQFFPVCSYYHSSVLPMLEQEIKAGLYKTILFLQRLRFKELLITGLRLKKLFFNINTIDDFNHLK